MWTKLLDSNYWFSQPSVVLTRSDLYLAWFFLACLILAIVLKVTKRLTKNPIKRNLMDRLFNLFLTVSLSGLVWYGFRYENTPIFAMHYWAGLVLLMGLVWFLVIAKYFAFQYFPDLADYDREQMKKKYIPGSK